MYWHTASRWNEGAFLRVDQHVLAIDRNCADQNRYGSARCVAERIPDIRHIAASAERCRLCGRLQELSTVGRADRATKCILYHCTTGVRATGICGLNIPWSRCGGRTERPIDGK